MQHTAQAFNVPWEMGMCLKTINQTKWMNDKSSLLFVRFVGLKRYTLPCGAQWTHPQQHSRLTCQNFNHGLGAQCLNGQMSTS